MPGPLESALETFFHREVRKYGGHTIKLAPIEAGTPDRLVMLCGKLFLVELKTEDGRLSAIQKHWHAKVLNQTGIEVVVLYGRDAMQKWVKEAFRTHGWEPPPDPVPEGTLLKCALCEKGWMHPPTPGRYPSLCPECRRPATATAVG